MIGGRGRGRIGGVEDLLRFATDLAGDAGRPAARLFAQGTTAAENS